nr:RNA-directed DNA polymerase, eukaryota, reverse transcriptase zinc-binding domain protein [Tanacetum cinerariifolium]
MVFLVGRCHGGVPVKMTGVTGDKHLCSGTVSSDQKKKVQGCSDVDNECLDCCFVIRGDRRRCVKNGHKGSVKAGGFGFGSLAVERKRYKQVALFSWSVERPLGTSLIGKRYGCQGDRRRCVKNGRKGSVKASGFGFGSLAVERKRYKRVALFSWSVERPLGTSLIEKRYGCQASNEELKRLHQKSKIKWLSEGDQNTAYFHGILKSRKHKGRIESICDNNGELNATLIALVPKVDVPNKVSESRPIACCNVIYKSISEILTNRLKVGCLPMKYQGVPLISKNKELVIAKIYWASMYMLPCTTIQEIEKLLKGFLWCQGPLTSGKAKVAWKQDWSQYGNGTKNESPKPRPQNVSEAKIQETEKKHYIKQIEVTKKDDTLAKELPYKQWAETEKKEDNQMDLNVRNEYSTGPDDSPSEDIIPKGRNFYAYESTGKSTSSDTTSTDTPKGRNLFAYESTSPVTASTSSREENASGFGSMAHPYIKIDLTKKVTAFNEKVAAASIPNEREEGSEYISKPVPRSMRNRRPFQPVASRSKNEIPKSSPKRLHGENLDRGVDEEEMKMDKLLLHYCRKPTHTPSVPTRSGSLPAESVATTVPIDGRKGLARVATYQPDTALSPQGHFAS